MAILIALVVFGALMAAISYLGYRHYARPGRLYEQLGGPATFTMPTFAHILQEEDSGLTVSIFEKIGQLVPVSLEDLSVTRKDLISAGYRTENAASIYFGIRAVSAVGLVVLALVFRTYIT